MKLRHRPAIALLCLPLLLTGCSGDDEEPEAKPPATSAAATTPSGTPTAEAWEEKSEEGARAFLRHWVDAVFVASTSGDTAELDRLALKNCISCRSTSRYLKRLYDKGGRLETKRSDVSWIAPIPEGVPIENPVLALQIRKAQEVEILSDGSKERVKPTTLELQFTLKWTAQGWRIAQWHIID